MTLNPESQTLHTTIKESLKDPLYTNALFLISANAITALLGFVFWVVAARSYSAEAVGLGSALIAAASLIALLSTLGLGYGLIRFLPAAKNRPALINSVLTLGGLISLAAAAIFILGLDLWAPSLIIVRHSSRYLSVFLGLVLISTLTLFLDQVLIARQKAGMVFTRTLIFNILRLAFPLTLGLVLSSLGIFDSWSLALGLAFLVGMVWLLPKASPGYRFSIMIKRSEIAGILPFSLANYLSEGLANLPDLLLPLLVINLAGAANNAYFFIAWAISGIIFLTPSLIAMSLFSQGSQKSRPLSENTRLAAKMMLWIVLPAAIAVIVLADKLLGIFGEAYGPNATVLLRLLTLSALPMAVNSLYFGVKRIEKQMRPVVLLTLLAAVLTFGLAYWLVPRMGITGAGIAWLSAQSATALFILVGGNGFRLLLR